MTLLRALLPALAASLLFGAGCPKTGAQTSGGTATTTGPAATTSRSSGRQETPPAPLVSEDGRRQQVDANGYPMFDGAGNPIWEPLPAEKAKQLFEEALVLSRGLAGAPPDLAGASARLTQALALKSDFPEAHYNLGLINLQLNQLDDAIRSLQSATKQRREYRDALLALGIAYERKGVDDVALRTFTEGTALDREDVDFLNGIARILRRQGKTDEAIDRAKAILQINSNSLEAYNTLGLAYLDQDELELARFVFMKSEDKDIGGALSASVQANLGLVFFRRGDEYEAETRFQRARELDGSHVGALVNLAYIRLKNLDFDAARNYLEEAHRQFPGNDEIRLSLAVALRGTGEYERARDIYEDLATRGGPLQADAAWNLGILYGDYLKDYDKALEYYDRYESIALAQGEVIGDDHPVREYVREVERAKKREERRKAKEDRRRQKEAEKAQDPSGAAGSTP